MESKYNITYLCLKVYYKLRIMPSDSVCHTEHQNMNVDRAEYLYIFKYLPMELTGLWKYKYSNMFDPKLEEVQILYRPMWIPGIPLPLLNSWNLIAYVGNFMWPRHNHAEYLIFSATAGLMLHW